MSQIDFWSAFIAGLLSFLSPCILPLVPGYISFVSGLSLEELTRGTDRKGVIARSGLGSVSFVLGFAIVFTSMGASASAIGGFLREYLGWISKIAGLVIVLFGLHQAGIFPIRWLYYEKRFRTSGLSGNILGSFAMGLAFAFGWTPCVGPILAGILALAATQDKVVKGMALLFVYSLGLGVPFILTSFGINTFIQVFNRYKKFIRAGEICAGILLVVVGILIFSNRLTSVIGLIPDFFLKFAL